MARSGQARLELAKKAIAGCLVAGLSAVTVCSSAVWSAPPRFDGAGYAVLAQALIRGEGYRAIEHPDQPRHAHFPPGYPLVLACTWGLAGESAAAAHVVSSLCAIGATLAAWLWFRSLLPRSSALVLGLALAVNWIWARTGSAIQSEPLYMFLGQVTILAAVVARRRRVLGKGTVTLGALLAASLLTRHVALGLALAVWIDLVISHRWAEATMSAALAAFFVSPWVVWMTALGSTHPTQAGLLIQSDETWLERIGRQVTFYIHRIPDQLTGPFVEVGTVFQRSPVVAVSVGVWSVLATGVIFVGWLRCIRRSGRRLAALIPIVTLGLLVVWPYTEAGRFLIPLIPCLLIGAEEGLVAMACQMGRVNANGRRPRRLRLYVSILIFLASLPYSCYMLAAGRTRALEATHRDFDAACSWIAGHAGRPGPVLSRHPGEVFWKTGRQGLEVPTSERPGQRDADSDAIARTIAAYKISYLLIDHERYAGAARSPLAQFVIEHPELVREVWKSGAGGGSVSVYEVHSDR